MKELSLPTPVAGPLRAELQRRTLRVLVMGQLVGAAALASAVTVGAFVVQDMLGQETPWTGLSTAGTTLGTAYMSQVLARVMRKRGRRPGLELGYGLALVGGLVAAVSAGPMSTGPSTAPNVEANTTRLIARPRSPGSARSVAAYREIRLAA